MTERENPYKAQAMRASGLRNFPLYPEGIKELRDILRGAGTTERATRIMDRVLATLDFCPTPKELRVLSEQIQREEQQAPTGCMMCGGEQWVMVAKLVWEWPKNPPGRQGKQYQAEGSERCTCAKGQWLRDKDRENAAKRAAGQPV